MVGIGSYGAYIPIHRMGKGTVGWRGRIEKAVAYFDEDTITMAVAATINCLRGFDRNTIDALCFATTTSPYLQKQAGVTIATAADLRKGIPCIDITNSLKSGTTALRVAVDMVKAGSAKKVLVVASDLRIPQAGSAFEQIFGDGAAAFIVEDSDIVANIENSCSTSDEVLDEWREEGGYIQTWEDRFILEEGYDKIFYEAVSAFMNENSLTPKDFSKAVLYSPNARRHGTMSKRLGFDPKVQVQDPLFATVGHTGVASTLMALVAALETAKGGDRILLANYGDGADIFQLQATDGIEKIKGRRGIKTYLEGPKKIISDYLKYARWRGLIDIAAAARREAVPMSSASALRRDNDKNLRFYGVKCNHCGYPQFPPQRVCTKCHSKDNFDPYPFSDKKGVIFTFSGDFLGDIPDPPAILSIVNFEGGGRAKLFATDCEISELKIGIPVEMTFRRFHSAGGIHAYHWKCELMRG